ncbi:MAG TPA: peptidoglycan-binding domain-containing protein [Nannocystis sp.]
MQVSRGEEVLVRGVRDDAVSRVREALARLGERLPPSLGLFDRALEVVLQRFQARCGRPRDGVLDAPTLLDLDAALRPHPTPTRELDLLLACDPDRPEYAAAVAAWPEDRPIWPLLPAGAPRLAFIRFCLDTIRPDRTRTLRAEQLYAQLSDRARIGPATRLALRAATGDEFQQASPRLRLPLLLASTPQHVYGAVYLDGDPQHQESYIFIDPAQACVVTPADDRLVLHDLAGHDRRERLAPRLFAC